MKKGFPPHSVKILQAEFKALNHGVLNPGLLAARSELLVRAVFAAGTSELVMLSLDLVKTRLAMMSMEMRKNFIQGILTSLIEKSSDAKILRAVVKIVEEWVKNSSSMAANQVT